MTFLRDLVSLRSSLENPATPITSAAIGDLFDAGPTAAGVSVTEKSALSIIAFFRGVQIIAQAVAAVREAVTSLRSAPSLASAPSRQPR